MHPFASTGPCTRARRGNPPDACGREPRPSILAAAVRGALCILLDVPQEESDEEHRHAEHEEDAADAHEPDVGGEEILESMHGVQPSVIRKASGLSLRTLD
jgi:hypothetical protein